MADPIGRAAASAALRFQGLYGSQGVPGVGGAQRLPGVGPDAAGLQVPLGPDGATFGETLTKAINEVSAAQERSGTLTRAFAAGEPVELHQVMAAAEEAGISLELMVEVRNKFTEAYRTLINMQS